MKQSIIPIERVQKQILLMRGEKVIIDADLAELYGVATKRLSEQVKRYIERFPEDLMFQQTPKRRSRWSRNCANWSCED